MITAAHRCTGPEEAEKTLPAAAGAGGAAKAEERRVPGAAAAADEEKEARARERVGGTSADDVLGAAEAGRPKSPGVAPEKEPASVEGPASGSSTDALAGTEQGKQDLPGHRNEADPGRGVAAAEEETAKGKETVCGTTAHLGGGGGSPAGGALDTASPGDMEMQEGEEFESQFAFRGSEAPSYVKRRGDDLHATPTENAKRFRGYSSDTEYKRIVPLHMQDGVKRLNQELLAFVNDPPCNITAAPTEDNLYDWQGIIRGPPRTPYEGGTWFIRFQIPETYPYTPPQVRFMNKIYHCNIDEDGAVCLNILKDDWTAAQSIHSILLSISALLASPNPADPLRQDAAQLLAVDPVAHDKVAREYTLKYATNLDGTKNKAAVASKPLPEFCAASYAGAGPSADSPSVNARASCADEEEKEDSPVAFLPSSLNGGPKLTKSEIIEQAKATAREAAPPEMLELQGGKTLMEILLDAAEGKK